MPSATVTRRIEFSDTDASGRYHYMTALRLFEAGESQLLADLGLLDDIYTSMPRAKITFEYRSTLYFMDEVEVTVKVVSLGRTSIVFGFECRRDAEICVEGELVAVQVDEEGKPRPWDDHHRDLLDPG